MSQAEFVKLHLGPCNSDRYTPHVRGRCCNLSYRQPYEARSRVLAALIGTCEAAFAHSFWN